jgi:hypothetical protein
MTLSGKGIANKCFRVVRTRLAVNPEISFTAESTLKSWSGQVFLGNHHFEGASLEFCHFQPRNLLVLSNLFFLDPLVHVSLQS